MASSLESFSVELLFEIFEYLSPYDLFRSFINLNDRFNTILYSYPLHLNCQSISRLEFDYICSHIQPKQVISLILSDEKIPHQVSIWKEYFPLFHEQFIHLQSLSLIEIFDEKLHLPASIKMLEIRKYDAHFDFTELIREQAKILTHLKIDRIGVLNGINTPFPALTHLIIDGGYNLDTDSYIFFSDQYENVDATSIFQHLGSSITHLHLFIDKENRTMKVNLQQFSHCLTHLTLHYFDDIVVSFQSFEQCLSHLYQLTHLTLQANGKSDLIDGDRWKNYLRQTNMRKFDFKFRILDNYLNINQDASIFLQSFRSSFWLKEKHWYVGYHYNTTLEAIYFYTIPRFRCKDFVFYPSSDFPYLTTTPSDIEQKIFYQDKIHCLQIDIDEFIIPPIHRFTQVESLILNGSQMMSLDILQTIIDLNQIKELDLADIKYFSRRELDQLIKHLPRLYSLTMKYHPLFVVPSQIRTLRFENSDQLISIDNLSHTIPYVKTLEIPIQTKDEMVDLIDQLGHINDFLFIFDDLSEGDYLEFFIEKFRVSWLEDNSYRLARNHFTFWQGDEFQQMQMAIGGPKTKKYSE